MQNKQTLSKPLVVMLLASLCCLLWGSAIPFINLGYHYFGVTSSDTATQILFGGCRFFLAGLLTILFESVAQKKPALPKKTSWGNVVKLSLTQTIIQYVFFYIGVAHTASAKGAIIQGLQAFTSILIACFLFRSEKMNALKWLGGFIGVAGVVIVNWTKDGFGGGVSFIGEGFVIISMIASACSTGLIKKFGQFDSPVVMSGWQFMLGGAVMAVCGFAAGGRLGTENPMGLRCAAVSGAALGGGLFHLGGVAAGESGFARSGIYVLTADFRRDSLAASGGQKQRCAASALCGRAGAHLREHCGGEPRAEDGGDGGTLRLCLKFRQEPEVSALPIG